jgi:hypothetical protein
MKTQLLLTIEHDEESSVDGLITYSIIPMVQDINSDTPNNYSITVERLETTKCIHCGRTITTTPTGWADMEATGDDTIWKYTCDENDTFPSDHEAEGRDK